MSSETPVNIGAVLSGGKDGLRLPDESVVGQRPAAAASWRGTAAGPWPDWARPQLDAAIARAESVSDQMSVARVLYREWFNPTAGDLDGLPDRALAGVYREAHAGSGIRVRSGSVAVVGRHDVIRAGGWWRTWGADWTPPRSRPGSIRLMLTPRPEALSDFVATVTGQLLHADIPWSLACAIDPLRIARVGSAVLDLPSAEAVPATLVEEMAPLLRPVAPPLCLPLAPGVGAAEYPENGMTFGEHRCHLVALALRHPSSARHPLRAIAAVFAAHGLDPAQPHRSR